MPEPDLDVLLDNAWAAVSLLKRSQGIVISEIQANDQRRWQVILDGLSGLRTRLREERRAGLSPIARTEIERVAKDMRGHVESEWRGGDDEFWVRITHVRKWLAALDSVLGAESTKEGKP